MPGSGPAKTAVKKPSGWIRFIGTSCARLALEQIDHPGRCASGRNARMIHDFFPPGLAAQLMNPQDRERIPVVRRARSVDLGLSECRRDLPRFYVSSWVIRTSSIRSSASLAQLRRLGGDLDPIDRRSPAQVLETPGQVRQVDPEHGRAHADHRREEVDAFVGMLLRQPIDQVKLGSHSPRRPRRALLRLS